MQFGLVTESRNIRTCPCILPKYDVVKSTPDSTLQDLLRSKSINQSNQQSPRLNFGSPPPKLIKSSHPLACCVLLRLASTRPFEKPRHTTAESTSPPPQPKSVLYGFTAGWRSVHLNSNRQLDSRPPSRLLRCERKGRYRFRSSFDLHSFTH